jgi:ABC-type phosphate transport system permease subunit
MLVLVIIAGVVCAVALCLYASCIIKEAIEAVEMRRFKKQLNKRWQETGKIFPE